MKNTIKRAARAAIGLPALLALALIGTGCPTDGGGGGGGTDPVAGELKTQTLSGVAVRMRYVPAGGFQRDTTATNVSVITKGYWLAETETTQELFQAVMESNPSYFDGESGQEAAAGETQGKRPVETVNWYHAIAFCNKLSLANGKQAVYSVDGIDDWAELSYDDIPTTDDTDWNAATMDGSKNGYRLPTEMEWMWAAMGADKTVQPNTTGYSKAFAGSSGSNSIDDYAWYWTETNGSDRTHEVGTKTANELGLKDMSGNVWEWCWDWFDGTDGSSGTVAETGELTDYTGAASGSYRVGRGGGWDDDASYCAAAVRSGTSPLGSVRLSWVPVRLPLSSAKTGLITPERLDRRRKPPAGAAEAVGRGAPAFRTRSICNSKDRPSA